MLLNNTNTTELATAVGNYFLQSQMGMPINGINHNALQTMSPEENDALLKMPLLQMNGAQYKALIETTVLNILMAIQRKPQKNYVYGIDGLAKLIGKSKNTAQRLKSSGVIDDAVIQDGRTIIIDGGRALELIKQHDVEEKAKKSALL